MDTRGGMDIPIITVVLIAFTIILAGAFLYWSTTYTKNLTENAEEDSDALRTTDDVQMKIHDIQLDPLFTSDLVVTLENTGKVMIEEVIGKVTLADGTILTDTFPKSVDYPSESLNLNFFEVKQFKIFFGSRDLRTYTRVEITPLVKDNQNNLKPVGAATKEWIPQP